MGGFILGAIVGAAVVWFWGHDLRQNIDTKTSGIRAKAADTLHNVADKLHTAGDTIEAGVGEPGAERRIS